MVFFAGSVTAVVVAGLLVVFALIFVLSKKEQRSSAWYPIRRDADYIHYGATLINDGYSYYPDWCSSMLREFDDALEPQLEGIYDAAKSVAELPPDQWASQISSQLEKGIPD